MWWLQNCCSDNGNDNETDIMSNVGNGDGHGEVRAVKWSKESRGMFAEFEEMPLFGKGSFVVPGLTEKDEMWEWRRGKKEFYGIRERFMTSAQIGNDMPLFSCITFVLRDSSVTSIEKA